MDIFIFYIVLILKLNIRVFVSYLGRRLEGDSLIFYVVIVLKLNLVFISNIEIKED